LIQKRETKIHKKHENQQKHKKKVQFPLQTFLSELFISQPSACHPNAIMAADVKTPEKDLCEALYNHLVLPPKLPHREDGNLAALEAALLDRIIASAHELRDVADQHDSRTA
jgi:hypothetical protein